MVRAVRDGRFGPVLRSLALFWGAVTAAAVVLGAVLQVLGPLRPGAIAHAPAPPDAAKAAASVSSPAADHAAGAHSEDAHAPAPPAAAPTAPIHQATAEPPRRVVVPEPGAPVAAPDPLLLEASPSFQGLQLPRIGPGDLRPSQVYAAGRAALETRPRIAVLMADIGANAQASEEAIRGLPAPVSFAIAPYGLRAPGLLDMARARGHEVFAVVPMEPSSYPLNDPGPNALLTGSAPAVNARNLEWALSRFNGYVGVTAVLGRMHGERYANAPELHAVMLEELGRRGLIYLDPRPGGGAPPSSRLPPFRAVDLVVDAPAVRSEVDERLGQLERRARENGTAIGLAEGPTPMVIDRIAAWATSLPVRGFALVPVSALIVPP